MPLACDMARSHVRLARARARLLRGRCRRRFWLWARDVVGVTQQAVHHQRKKHGIPALHPGHGPGPGLGAVPQTEPCRRAGCPNLAWWKYDGACCPEHEGPA